MFHLTGDVTVSGPDASGGQKLVTNKVTNSPLSDNEENDHEYMEGVRSLQKGSENEQT